MSIKNDENNLTYADKAFITFNKIMSNKQKNMIDNVNRANKGELFILQFLLMHKTEALPSELSAALHASTARISALLGALEKKGQIVRNIDINNRRNILVTITEAGRIRAETELKKMKNSMTRVFTDMGEEDTEEFIRLTSKFFELLQKHSPQE
ncbi:MAG: MarR family transcriptional regulator [Clostridiales bacterium 43-6]|nr:MAG: MarR family transcriptional regulator [Clostridiales bacterium 43-6]